jgi:hypothetical protein
MRVIKKADALKMIKEHGRENLYVKKYLECKGSSFLVKKTNNGRGETLCRLPKNFPEWFPVRYSQTPFINIAHYLLVYESDNPNT